VQATRYAGLDVDQALRVWRDEARYQSYLRMLLADYSGTLSALDTLEPAAQAAMVHKFAGAAGNLGLMPASQAAKAYEQARRGGADLQAALAELARHCSVAWASIAQYLAENTLLPEPAAQAAQAAAPAGAVAPLLEQLRAILASDNPEGSDAVLQALAAHLGEAPLQPLRKAIAMFDFRQAERILHSLANAS
jgi:HPt (histidine-containing phosphotransfer) domain-containing protein